MGVRDCSRPGLSGCLWDDSVHGGLVGWYWGAMSHGSSGGFLEKGTCQWGYPACTQPMMMKCTLTGWSLVPPNSCLPGPSEQGLPWEHGFCRYN